jgi:hypothetical protein
LGAAAARGVGAEGGAGEVLGAALLAAALSAVLFLLEGREGLDLADEGYLWVGLRETLAGAVPLRDFQSYEPARYYWAALFGLWLGDGILALRLATTSFGALGLWWGLLVARRISPSPWFLLPCGALLALWLAPRHKLFEPSLALLGLLAAVRLLEQPGPGRHAAAGVAVGFAACFGRNHALYAGLGFALLFLWRGLRLREPGVPAGLLAFLAGGLAGFSPALVLCALAPGLATSWLDSLLFYLEQGPNHPTPAPWPWRLDFAALDWLAIQTQLSLGIVFLLALLFLPTGLLLAWRTPAAERPRRAVVVAAAAIGLFYAHHASVRSDASHLAQCIQPVLLGSLALLRTRRPWLSPALVGLGILTLFALPEVRPSLARRLPWVVGEELEPLDVAGDRLELPRRAARELRQIASAVEARVDAGDALFIAPAWPGLYPLLSRRPPVWWTYFLWPAEPDREERLVAALDRARVDWSLIQTGAPFGVEELRFERSHPRVWQHLEERFEPAARASLPPGHLLLERRRATAARAGAASPAPRRVPSRGRS